MAEIKKRFDYDIKELNLGGGFGATYIDEERKPYAYFLAAPMMERIEAFFTELGVERPAVVIAGQKYCCGGGAVTLYDQQYQDIRDIRKYVSVA